MKFYSLLVNLLLVLSLLISPVAINAQSEATSAGDMENIDVYALFWPIVPGKTVADSTFWLKQLKESMGGFFSFGDISKSKYQIELSEKRLVEANKLFENKDYVNAFKSLDLNKQHRNQAVLIMKKAQEEKRKVGELKTRIVTSLENQQLVLRGLLTRIPPDIQGKVEEIVDQFTLQISESR